MADASKTIGGKLKPTAEQQRDAIHVAVISVIAAVDIYKGQEVDFVYGSSTTVRPAVGSDYGKPGIGIADPFIEGYIKAGERFWLFMRPGTVSNLAHSWTHPVVDSPAKITSEAEQWLRDFADRWNFDYGQMVENASTDIDSDSDHPGDGRYITAMGINLHSAAELGGDHDKFWHQLEELTGKKFPEEHRTSFGWSCSC